MLQNSDSHEYMTLTQVANSDRCPGRPSSASVWRWARRGIKARSGKQIHLQHIRAGGRVLVRPEWLDQFFKELAAADSEHFDRRETEPAPKGRTTNQRHRAVAHAKKQLAASGY